MEHRPEYEKLAQKVKELEQERQNRKKAEEALLESRQRYVRFVNTIPCVLYDYVRQPDGRNRFLYISSKCKEIFEYDADRLIADSDLMWNMVHPEDLDRLMREDQTANQAATLFQSEVRIVPPSGRMKWIWLISMPSAEKVDSGVIWSGAIFDISDRKLVEEENSQLMANLQKALADVEVLSGLLPICSNCKSIRDDEGLWYQIDAYFHAHSGMEFSHGICPKCAKLLYPGYDLFKEDGV